MDVQLNAGNGSFDVEIDSSLSGLASGAEDFFQGLKA